MVRETAIQATPWDYKLKGDMGQFYDYYGKMDLGLGDPKDALLYFDRSIALLREVEALDKDVVHKVNLSISLYDRGQAAIKVGDRDGARRYFAECLGIREKLSAADQANGAMRMDLMLVLPHCGGVERAARLAEELSQGPRKGDRAKCFSTLHAVTRNARLPATARLAGSIRKNLWRV